jgi:hypothetical protein
VWLLAFFPFVTSSCACSPKALHDQQYQLETLRDLILGTKPTNNVPKALHGQQYKLEILRN